jgi:hypothetical protein
LDFLAHPFWDKYLEFEERLEAPEKIFAILDRVIKLATSKSSAISHTPGLSPNFYPPSPWPSSELRSRLIMQTSKLVQRVS